MTAPVIFILISLSGAFIIGWITSWLYSKNQREELIDEMGLTQVKLEESLEELSRTRNHIEDLKLKVATAIDHKAYEELQGRYQKLEEDHIELERNLTFAGRPQRTKPGLLEEIGLSITGEVPPSDRDDLTKINGISPYIQDRLYKIGLVTYEQISRLTEDQARLVNDAIEVLPGRVRKERWVEQSRRFVRH